MSTLSFAAALLQAEAQARSTLDVALHERLSCAVALVKEGRVFQTSQGTWQVDSASTEGVMYSPNGTCQCEDVRLNHPPEGLCKHQISVYLARRAQHLMAQPPAPMVPRTELVPDGCPSTEEPMGDETLPDMASDSLAEQTRRIPARFLHAIQGQPAIKYAGLLHLATEAGLHSLVATWTYNDSELSLAQAVAVFADGRRFEECGDSTPQNAARVKLHWRRLALTRAKARCLKDALNIALLTSEEME